MHQLECASPQLQKVILQNRDSMRPHLLIVDSHKSHMYNVAFFDLMKEMNKHVMAIPPHTSHIVQALDSTPFAQFKKLWQRYLSQWNFDTRAKALPKNLFWEIFSPAWNRAMTVANIQSGLRKTGLYPVNFDAIDKAKFTPSIVPDSKNICSPYVDSIVFFQQRIVCYLCCALC